MSTLKVISWNIFWGLGTPKSNLHQMLKGVSYLCTRRDRKTIPLIAKAIKKYQPLIVALQEVDNGSIRNGHNNQVEQISKSTGLNYFEYSVEKSWFGYFNDGNALLSQVPYTSIEINPLPYRFEKRNIIVGTIAVGKKKLTILTTHLGAHKSNQKERIQQAKTICELLTTMKPPVILMGDFNCQRGDLEFKYLQKHSGLVPIIASKTYPTHSPTQEFDQIFVSPDVKVKKSGLILEKYSDHFGVYAELNI